MSLEEAYQLNKRYPIRMNMLLHSIKSNLTSARQQINTDARKTRTVRLLLKLATDDLKDLEYSLKKGIIEELYIEFKGSHSFSSVRESKN